MDHSDALRLQAAEKYVLGDLSPELRDEYEEHYFDCQACATDVKTAVAFVDATRAAFREDSRKAHEPQPAPAPRHWLAWLRPAIAVPAMAALVAILGYQTFVAIPALKRNVPTAVGSANFVSLIGENSRGQAAARSILIQRDKPAILEIDIPPSSDFSMYLCSLQRASGQAIFAAQVSAADAASTVHLIVPAGVLHPGPYTLVISGQKLLANGAKSQAEIARLHLPIEFAPAQ
jgi:hypothetical protein